MKCRDWCLLVEVGLWLVFVVTFRLAGWATVVLAVAWAMFVGVLVGAGVAVIIDRRGEDLRLVLEELDGHSGSGGA